MTIYRKNLCYTTDRQTTSANVGSAETLWRIHKDMWIKPAEYASTDFLLYAVSRALARLGSELHINFSHET
jgi:hypothetical protein